MTESANYTVKAMQKEIREKLHVGQVNQDKFGEEGNCMQACLASFFNISLEEALELKDEEGWFDQLQEWCLERGFVALSVLAKDDIKFRGMHFLGGESHRGMSHLVLVFDGEIVWDPHPDNTGLKTIEDWILMLPVAKRFDWPTPKHLQVSMGEKTK